MPARHLLRTALLSLALLSATVHAAPDAPDWAASARQDIRFAIDTVATRHAGIVAGLPSVSAPLAAGSALALAQVDKVQSEQDYLRLMRRFIAGFGDPHTGIDLRQKTRGWTGIVLDLVDGRYRVVWAEPGWPTPLPPTGAIVQSCDGAWIGTWLKEEVAPFNSASVEYAGTFSALAQQVMFDAGLGWTPKACVFDLPDGSRRRYALPLQVAGDAAGDAATVARFDTVRRGAAARAKPVGMTALGKGRYWVGMPDFNGAASGAAYGALYRQLATVKDADWIVFDLRGNGGGDSSWGRRALGVLFGEAYGRELAEAGGMQKYLIADAATIALLQHYAAAPEFAASKDEFAADLAKVREAMRAGRRMAQVSGAPPASDAPPLPLVVKRPHGPRLAAVIDRNCFSSCMNFVQQLQATGDAVLLGEATIGYSPLGEIARVDLPSGRGALYIPTALYVTAQATREPFVPDYPYPGRMGDDDGLAAWVGRTLDGLRQERQGK
ncbi:S41 family peptidase [Massilia sp. TN1-12]|uniref:S41 family peptidase n=1 Tax=Massilia paldalensis TaxID=3377675 RepID=UPI00384B2B62